MYTMKLSIYYWFHLLGGGRKKIAFLTRWVNMLLTKSKYTRSIFYLNPKYTRLVFIWNLNTPGRPNWQIYLDVVARALVFDALGKWLKSMNTRAVLWVVSCVFVSCILKKNEKRSKSSIQLKVAYSTFKIRSISCFVWTKYVLWIRFVPLNITVGNANRLPRKFYTQTIRIQ